MPERRTKDDRRAEERFATGGRVFWKRPGRQLNYVAWLSDASHTSTSFVTTGRTRPSVGDQIELGRFAQVVQRCQVTRTEAYDSRRSLVACTSTAGDAFGERPAIRLVSVS